MMDKEWMKTVLPIIVTVIIGWWTLYSKFDSKFDQIDVKFDRIDERLERIDARIDRIDSRLARVEGWIEGRFDDASAETAAVSADSLVTVTFLPVEPQNSVAK